MTKQERIELTITRTVVFKKSLTFDVKLNAPILVNGMGIVNNMLENAVEIASNWKGSSGDS